MCLSSSVRTRVLCVCVCVCVCQRPQWAAVVCPCLVCECVYVCVRACVSEDPLTPKHNQVSDRCACVWGLGGGLKSADMMFNKKGAIVPVRKHQRGKQATWISAVKMSKKEMGLVGFHIPRRGSRLWHLAKDIMQMSKAAAIILEEP